MAESYAVNVFFPSLRPWDNTNKKGEKNNLATLSKHTSKGIITVLIQTTYLNFCTLLKLCLSAYTGSTPDRVGKSRDAHFQ